MTYFNKKILVNKDFARDYVYYSIANPWLQVKLLRFLRSFPLPENTPKTRLYEVLRKILASVDAAKGQTVNHKNSLNAVLFEAIYLVIYYDEYFLSYQ